MPNKIIVTGGAGYIGTHTTVALQTAGFDVVTTWGIHRGGRLMASCVLPGCDRNL